MEYKTEGCRFTVPDSITVRKQLAYSSIISFTPEEERLLTLWKAAQSVVDEWECESIPVMAEFDPDKSEDPEHARIVGWAGLRAWEHMVTLKEVPKK